MFPGSSSVYLDLYIYTILWLGVSGLVHFNLEITPESYAKGLHGVFLVFLLSFRLK